MARVLVVDDALFMRKMVSDALTKGGPSGSTEVLAYLIYKEAFETGNVGRAAVMACVMMLLLMGLTLAQNLYFRKRTTYELV